MEFDLAYNVHCSLRLESGRVITLERLTQTRTYSGLLEGTPNKWSNDRSIEATLSRIRRDESSLGEPYLIDPERRDYLREPGDMQAIIDRQQSYREEANHIPEWLPPVECVGVFDSLKTARDHTKHASSLTIVWYQDDFGFDKIPVERLRLVEWDQLATDWEY